MSSYKTNTTLLSNKAITESVVVIGTRKHFEVTHLYKLFCHMKCTVAAAYNLSVCKLQRIMVHKKFIGIFCQAVTPLFIEVLFVLMPVAFVGLCVDM